MEFKITGCIDCPLFDSTGAEYKQFCHHPQRPVGLDMFDIDNGWDAVEPTQEEIKNFTEAYLSGNMDTFYKMRDAASDKKRAVRVLEPVIEDDEKYNPVTPVWCPLKKELLSITY
jgi:hypothetical protein